MRRGWVAVWLVVVVAACGARTGLLAPEIETATESGVDAHDESVDASSDAVVFPDVPITTSCIEAGVTYIYVLGLNHELYSFYPPTLAFTSIGSVDCESDAAANSMAVTRSGIAFANYADGTLFEVSTANAACKTTSYDPSQNEFVTFGMGYSGNQDGGETLYVALSGAFFSNGLALIDTSSFKLDFVAQFIPQELDCELTGTGSGRLFGFCPFGTGSYLEEFDPANAHVIASHQLATAGGGESRTWAFAFWGGEFWLFTGSYGVPSIVTRYDPVALTETVVATAPISIVGAGVSTCAPE